MSIVAGTRKQKVLLGLSYNGNHSQGIDRSIAVEQEPVEMCDKRYKLS